MSRVPWFRCSSAALVFLLVTASHAEYSVTDLVDAAKRGDYHAVHRLITEDADLSVVGPMGCTALHWAGIRGYWRIVSELVAAGAPVNAKAFDGGTPLHWTCHHDRADMVQLLLEAGADLSVHNRWGRTPLHVASRRGCSVVAEVLLDAGADPNARTREGWTPLHVASRAGQRELVELLLANGADPKLVDDEGLTPIEVFRARKDHVTTDAARFEEYTGLYDLGHGTSVKVWREDDRLRIREFAPDDLYPVGDDRFACGQEPWEIRFGRGDNGAVVSIDLDFLRRTVSGTRTDVSRYVGSRVCMTCHNGDEHGQQNVIWMRSRHAHAYWRLGGKWALYLAGLRPNYGDLDQPLTDDRCLQCHVTGRQDPDAFFAEDFRMEEGVGCEACHGPGSRYVDEQVMSDREAFLAAGGVLPDEATCRRCHRNSERFNWAELWPKVAHPRPEAGS